MATKPIKFLALYSDPVFNNFEYWMNKVVQNASYCKRSFKTQQIKEWSEKTDRSSPFHLRFDQIAI